MKQLLIFFMAFALVSCENSESEINAFGKKAVQKDQAKKIESYLSQGGKVKARLTAPVMVRVVSQFNVDTPYVEFPKTLHVDFFNDQKIVENKLDALYGKYFESLNKVYLRDSVVVISIKGDTLTCEDLWWDQEKELFYTDKPALLKQPTGAVPAKNGLDASQDFKRINFKEVRNGYQISEGDAFSPGQPASATTDSAAAPQPQ
ncbi:LPS export ABC transporter periplasmic protein LptC [Niabella insulamsoli]|uniref:LPS export ABC transporter periplasmic protein LptC n=1 Tax=Niabella insulamsoli TaxID=3144874 RepID=UPI0031FC7B85